jgi:HPt (histidine-containing phosphotransfer) domain-containing protein
VLRRPRRTMDFKLEPKALAAIRELQAPGEPDLVPQVIEAFLADAPTFLAHATDALATGNAEQLADAAHALKSGAGYLGAQELQSLCLELEHLGRSGVTDGGQPLAEPLRIAFEQTRRVLIEELARQDAAA